MHGDFQKLFLLGLAASLLIGSSACRPEARSPSEVIKAELAARQVRQAESAQLVQKALRAYEDCENEKARKYLQQAIAADDRNVHAWMGLGAVEYKDDHLFEAAKAFDKAGYLASTRYEPLFNLGLVYERAGLCRKATQAYEAALKRDPDQVEVMENLARCYITSRSQPEKTFELVKRALELEMRPEWLRWLEAQLERLNRPVAAAPVDRLHTANFTPDTQPGLDTERQ